MRSISSLALLLRWFFTLALMVGGAAQAQDDGAGPEAASPDPADAPPPSRAEHDGPRESLGAPVDGAAAEGAPAAAPAAAEGRTAAAEASTAPVEPGALDACPAGSRCVPDDELLAAVLALEEALGAREGIALAIQRLAALEDARVVSRLLGLSRVRSREVRLSSLQALTAFVELPAVQERLYLALEKDALADEAAIALPALLQLARDQGPLPPSACVDAARCTDDARLLGALLRLYEADEGGRPVAVAALGALEDARAIPVLWRLSYTRRTALRHAALAALARQPEDPRVQRRLLEIVESGLDGDVLVVLPGLALIDDAAVTAALERARRERGDPRLRRALAQALAWRRTPRAEPGAVADAREPASASAPTEAAPTEAAPTEAAPTEAAPTEAAPTGAVPTGAASTGSPREGSDPADPPREQREPVASTPVVSTPPPIADGDRPSPVEAGAPAPSTPAAPHRRQMLPIATDDDEQVAEAGRWLVTGAAAFAGAYGGFASAHVIADAVGAEGPGLLGVDQQLLYGLYGLTVGGASAGAVTWFSLGDARLTASDLLLSMSGGVWGAYAGALVPLAIDTGTAKDLRHSAYAAAVGQLVGLGLGTAGAHFVDADGSDQLELHLTLLASNAIAAGVLLSAPEGGDPRWLLGSMVGATLAGAAAYPFLRPVLDLDGLDGLHLLTGTSVGFAVGLQAGIAATAFEPHPTRGFGFTLLGGALGLGTTLALSTVDARPSIGGNLYEAYATTAGSLAGIGTGMFIERLPGLEGEVPPGVVPFALGAALGLGGALSTVAFPEGVQQDAGDLLLQPLLIGYSLYHTTLALGVAGAPPELTLASALVAPSLVSLAVTHAAPYVSPRLSDLVLIGAMTGWGAWVGALGTASVNGRVPVPAWGWVLATSVGMDLGVAAGVGLGLLDVEDIGWRVAYVTASAGAASLVLALPGSLLAIGTNGVVQVPDVLLASTLLGAGVGLLTMPLIDFGIAPDIDLDAAIPLSPLGLEVRFEPSIQALAPTMQASETSLTYGVMGTF